MTRTSPRQKQASVACTILGCKGRHAQKLHEVLKDIFREEGRVHVLQKDDGWEESDRAWELEEAEGMIVGAVRQESECSWPDACNAWAALDEETEVGIHQVGVGETGTSRADQEEEQLEAEGLLIEGEEREYVLELLLRETSTEACVSNHSANARPATSKSKRKRNLERRLHKKARVTEEAGAKVPRKDGGRVNDREGKKQAIHGMPCGPEARGGKAAKGERSRGDQPATPLPTSGRECSA
jgi:hypothetical protein